MGEGRENWTPCWQLLALTSVSPHSACASFWWCWVLAGRWLSPCHHAGSHPAALPAALRDALKHRAQRFTGVGLNELI